MRTHKRKYAFVCPRFGEGIAGGEHTLVRNLASHLSKRGDHVQIITTCAKDNRTWENHFQPGPEEAFGLTVHRFPVDERDLDIWIPLQIKIHEGGELSLDEQLEWMTHSVNSTPMYQYIVEVADNFDAIFFAPYLFGTTFWGSLLRPDKSVLIPCLHDESYAYTDVIASMFRQTKGSLFNAEPEMHLARELYGNVAGGEVGMGFELFPESEVTEIAPYFESSDPFIVYVGRKETGKNAHLLIDYFVKGKDSGKLPSELKLVIVGGGDFADLHRPEAEERADILDIGFVSELEKKQLMKQATVVCQPSTNESFSIVLMEAWRLGTPVLVHAHCAVTSWHVVQSGGGLYFANASEFSAALNKLLDNPELPLVMAESGKQYTAERYSWDAVLARFDRVMDSLLEESHSSAALN